MRKPTAKTVEEVNIYLEGLSVRIPDTSTDNRVVRFDGTGGAMQGSNVTIDDSDNITTKGAIVSGSGATGNNHVTVDAPKDTANADLGFRSSGSNRWTIRRTADTESGSGAGSHLAIIRRDDSGAAISPNAVQIYRDTGKIMVGSVGATAGIEMGSGGPRDMAGSGSPEGVISAPVGSVWRRTDGGIGTSLYIKEAGTGNTGWVAYRRLAAGTGTTGASGLAVSFGFTFPATPVIVCSLTSYTANAQVLVSSPSTTGCTIVAYTISTGSNLSGVGVSWMALG